MVVFLSVLVYNFPLDTLISQVMLMSLNKRLAIFLRYTFSDVWRTRYGEQREASSVRSMRYRNDNKRQ